MQRFLNDISRLTDLPVEEVLSGFRVVFLSGRALYIEGIVKIITLDKESMVFKLKKGCIKIVGHNMTIKDLNIGSVMVVGSINCIEVM